MRGLMNRHRDRTEKQLSAIGQLKRERDVMSRDLRFVLRAVLRKMLDGIDNHVESYVGGSWIGRSI